MSLELVEQLRRIVGDSHVLTGEAVRARNVVWGRQSPCLAKAIVRPADTRQVSEVLALCHRLAQPVVPHGGRTGLVQGTVTTTEDIALSLERMNAIDDVDPVDRTVTVQAGALLQVVQERAEAAGLMLGLDLGARGTATIGGNISTNAGGESVIRYGTAREQVLGIEAVLADGTVISSMNRLIKNNSGYDLKQLFIGTEGTLGIVTRAVLRLRPRNTSRQTALLACPSFAAVVEVLVKAGAELGGRLSSFEVMWPDFYRQVTTPPAQGSPLLPQDHSLYAVIEAQGPDPDADGERFQQFIERCHAKRLVPDAVIAQSESQAHAIWALREDVDSLIRAGHPVHFDIGISVRSIEAYLHDTRSEIAGSFPDALFFAFGHLGDNNIHICVSLRASSEAAEKRVKDIIYAALRKYSGAVSAEHGIGLEKTTYLGISRTPGEIALMKTLKNALDPRGILNPGKVFA